MRITVRNNLQLEGITLHWHGLHMLDNYWNDGAAFVSQCPISSGIEFTYVVRADNSGTHWWHAHSGIARLDGLFGPLVVLEPDEIKKKMTSIPITMGDWYESDSISYAANEPFRIKMNMYPGNGRSTCSPDHTPFYSGLLVTGFCLNSFVVNGHGQLRLQQGKNFALIFELFLDPRKALFSIGERFLIPMSANSFQLRMINTGFEMFSAVTRLDGQRFNVTASDGRDLEPMTGDVLILGVAETYDINLNLSQDQKSVFLRFWLPFDHIGEASRKPAHQPFVDIEFKRDASVLEGEFKTEFFMRKPDEPIFQISPKNVSATEPVWINCPAPKNGVVCRTVSDFKRLESSDYKFESERQEESINTPATVSPLEEPDVILKIHVNFMSGAGINGIHFKYPTAPLFNGTDSAQTTKCTKEQLEGAGGFCTQVTDKSNVKVFIGKFRSLKPM